MKPEMMVLPAVSADLPQYSDWTVANAANSLFDPRVLEYPNTAVLKAFKGKPVGYIPVQTVAVLESFAPDPAASDYERAEALRELVKAAALLGWGVGIREIHFIVSDEATAQLALKRGFEEIPQKVLRLKLNRLEDKDACHNTQ